MPFPAIHNSWLLNLVSCWRNLEVAMFVCLFVCFSFYVSMVSVVSKVKIWQGQGNVFIQFDEKMSETDYWTDPSDTNQTLKLWGRARDSDMCCCITFLLFFLYGFITAPKFDDNFLAGSCFFKSASTLPYPPQFKGLSLWSDILLYYR